MDTLFALCILGIFMMMLFMMFMMMMRGMARASSYPPGGTMDDTGGRTEPTYDDPDISSRGTFGRPSTTYDDPNISSRGSFGRPRGGTTTRSGGGLFSSRSRAGRVDSPNISSRGSFGRKRK